MIQSVHRDFRHSIQLNKDYSTAYSVQYYPVARKKYCSSLAYIQGGDNNFGAISLYTSHINTLPGDRQELTKLLVKHINQACKNLGIKFPSMTMGFYKNKYAEEDFRLRYYNRELQAYILDDCYTTKKEGESNYITSVGIQMSRYVNPQYSIQSYERSFWCDPHSYYNGLFYFQETYITPEVAQELLLHQIENKIKLSSFLKKRLDDDGRETIDTAINLLKMKEVA